MVRFAAIGDIHGHWSAEDTRHFSDSDYDAVLVVGDLAGLRFGPTLSMAEELGRIGRPTVVVPGNHDGPNPAQLLAEVAGTPRLGDAFTAYLQTRWDALDAATGTADLGAYSTHRFGPPDDAVTVVVGRPLSMGGPTLAFAGFLGSHFDVHSLEESAQRLRTVIDTVETERMLFVAHNGPAGLGARRSDIWGCDFRAAEGDWGDPDLEDAVAYARASGRQVMAVIAGHMHRKLRGGGERTSRVERDGVVYVNAARVPRVTRSGRHHVRVEIQGRTAHISDVSVLS